MTATTRTAASYTFDVSDVGPIEGAYPEAPYHRAVEALLTTGLSEPQRRMIQVLEWAWPEPPPRRPVEACSSYHGRLLADVLYHPLVAAVHLAYMRHRPLRLSPDMIWLMICQGVANHVRSHGEELRRRLVPHDGGPEIVVRRDDFLKGSPENPWPEVFSEFSAAIRRHLGPSHGLFEPGFSTTGPAERAATDIVLLHAMQSYFTYVVRVRCGIPSITLEGTPEDWEWLSERAEAFAPLGLGRWLEVLGPILRQFAAASRGRVDRPFWRSIYKDGHNCEGPFITGWIVGLLPYLKDLDTGESSVPNRWIFEGPVGESREVLDPHARRPGRFQHGLSFEILPGGLSSAPFAWQARDRAYEMEFLGGFVGVRQDPETLALRPEIGWAVQEAATPA